MSASARPSTIPGEDDGGEVMMIVMIVMGKSPKADKVYIFLTFT